jgi:hypothetical protein
LKKVCLAFFAVLLSGMVEAIQNNKTSVNRKYFISVTEIPNGNKERLDHFYPCQPVALQTIYFASPSERQTNIGLQLLV